MAFSLIPFCHLLFFVIFDHILIQIFLQFITGLDQGYFLWFSFRLSILVSSGGTVKSPKLISSPSGAGVFWEGREFGGGLCKSAKFAP